MAHAKHSLTGFTIVETLLVLAISSAIFLAIILTMSGRQGKAEFSQATKNLQADIQQTINEVASGFYPSASNFRCDKVSNKPKFTPVGSKDQGTNQDCVFLGKVVQFKVGSSDPEQFNVYSIAGLRRCNAGLGSACTLAQAKPTAIDDGSVSVTQTKKLSYGLTTKWMKVNGTAPVGAVGFISELGGLDDAGNYSSGSQPVDLIPVQGTNIGDSKGSMVSAINANLATSATNPSGGVEVCFQSGTTNQTALLTIGSNSHDLTVKMEVKTC